jgi:hypothetical protein
LESFLYGLLGGLIAWFVTAFLAAPFFKFRNLRHEASRVLALYEDRIGPHDSEAQKPSVEWLTQRQKAYEDCGAELVAFASSNSMFTRLLHRVPLAGFRCYPRNAGHQLVALADAKFRTSSSEQLREQVERQLNLKYRP